MSIHGHDRLYYRQLTDRELLAEAQITMNIELGIVLAERLDNSHQRKYGAPVINSR